MKKTLVSSQLFDSFMGHCLSSAGSNSCLNTHCAFEVKVFYLIYKLDLLKWNLGDKMSEGSHAVL